MSESQSRYSIVERLTTTKISFIDEKNRLDEELEALAQEITSRETGVKSYEEDAFDDIKREIRTQCKKIAEYEKTLLFKEKQKSTKLDAIDAKIKQVDQALESIQKISETAPSAKDQA